MTVSVCGVRRTAGLLTMVAVCAVVRLGAECADVKNSREGKKYATHVFSGRVTDVDTGDFTVRFEVNRVWKGVVHRQFLMFVMPGEDVWSAKFFKEGTSYLVFADAFSSIQPLDATPSFPSGTPVVWISMCNGTRPVENARSWLEQLGSGKSPKR